MECDALKDWKVNIFKIIDRRIPIYSQNTNMLPHKPKISYRYLKLGIHEFHRKYVLIPADKAANNVVVGQLHNINTLNCWVALRLMNKSVINHNIFQNATRFGVSVDEDQEGLPTFYWLPKLHKQPYKSRIISNSSSCTATELSKLLTSCLTTIINHVIKYCEKVYERSGKNLFWSI